MIALAMTHFTGILSQLWRRMQWEVLQSLVNYIASKKNPQKWEAFIKPMLTVIPFV